MEPILVGNLFVISQINPTGQQECEIFETQMLIVTHPYLDSLELIERWVCSEKEQWENSWKTSSSCQKTVTTSHWSMSGFNNYLNGLATLNLYSLGDCPLACLPQDYGRIYAVPLPSPEERGYPMIRRHFFYQRKLKANQTRKVGNDIFASWASEKSTEEIPLKTCQIRLIPEIAASYFQKLQPPPFPITYSSYHFNGNLRATITVRISLQWRHGAVLELIVMTKVPFLQTHSNQANFPAQMQNLVRNPRGI